MNTIPSSVATAQVRILEADGETISTVSIASDRVDNCEVARRIQEQHPGSHILTVRWNR
jgi:hypothetical protein